MRLVGSLEDAPLHGAVMAMAIDSRPMGDIGDLGVDEVREPSVDALRNGLQMRAQRRWYTVAASAGKSLSLKQEMRLEAREQALLVVTSSRASCGRVLERLMSRW
ncbi:hypothetical protein HGRIS_003257 [Hohenbuehelia grisea]|uniref:Uncharacterized protein n=1 Tax=Hohenbuehelia grisea TaxID=104357 RepID=A0ABR3JNX5_9AGAR